MARLGRTTWICYILILQLLNAQWCCDSFVQCHSISTSAQSFPSSRLGATSTAAAVLFPERFCRSLGSDMVDYNNSLQRLPSRRTLHLQRSPPELTQPPPGLEQHRNYPNDSLPAELQPAPPGTTVAPDVLDHLGKIPVDDVKMAGESRLLEALDLPLVKAILVDLCELLLSKAKSTTLAWSFHSPGQRCNEGSIQVFLQQLQKIFTDVRYINGYHNFDELPSVLDKLPQYGIIPSQCTQLLAQMKDLNVLHCKYTEISAPSRQPTTSWTTAFTQLPSWGFSVFWAKKQWRL